MKKLLLVAALVAALPASLFAQGNVNFANTSGTLLTTNSGAQPPAGQAANQTGSTTGAGQYTIGLYIAPAGTVDTTLFTLANSGAATTPSQSGLGNGRFAGGNPFVINGNNGTDIAFQIRVWSTSAGSTYEIAKGVAGAYVGQSTIGDVTPSLGAAPVPALFGAGAGQISSGIVLVPVTPEPSSIALGLLGLGAIALFRRRK